MNLMCFYVHIYCRFLEESLISNHTQFSAKLTHCCWRAEKCPCKLPSCYCILQLVSGILARKLLIYLSDPVSFSAYMIYDFISKETADERICQEHLCFGLNHESQLYAVFLNYTYQILSCKYILLFCGTRCSV